MLRIYHYSYCDFINLDYAYGLGMCRLGWSGLPRVCIVWGRVVLYDLGTNGPCVGVYDLATCDVFSYVLA
jgi:hypothetical protein